MQDASLDPDSCPPPMRVHSRTVPLGVRPHASGLMPVTGLHWCVQAHGKILQPRKNILTVKTLTAVCESRFSPISCYWLALLASPASIPSLLCTRTHLLQPTSLASTAMHLYCHAPAMHLWRDHGTTGVHTYSLSSSSFMWVQIWPRLLPLACTVRLTYS